MKSNVGTVDRIFRVVMGLALLSLIFLLDSDWRWVGFIGLVVLFTAATSWCPAYRLMGITTRTNRTD
jgi:hypothetical protein